MRVVGSTAGISIQAPEDAYFSYFNSPYVGHDIGSAIDIYPRHQVWYGDVVSPVSGKVVKIKKMRMGQPKDFPTHDFDYAIGILPEESNNDIVRIMHCEPTVSVGETVSMGGKIGHAIRSRYFNYWTGPHYHVEIVPSESFERSTKSYPLELTYHFEAKKTRSVNKKNEFLVCSVTKDHIVGYAENLGQASIGDLVGLPAVSEDEELKGILDGGLSHYKIGGVIGSEHLREGTQVYLLDSSVGTIRKSKSGTTLFDRGPSITSFLDMTELRGLSCFIYSKHYTKRQVPQLILIPKRYGQFKDLFNEGDLHELRIVSSNNTVKAGQVK
ncbi:MAG: M23 family metallopeptidase [Candidatus Thorarchaeota archaeon SMTZ1-45]|nr:MAG: hypothetical protein AM325_08630 [Candidatus Thorarchaeota archaeon SMTZ1-45]